MELGDLITKYRKKENMTIDELAVKSNVPKGTLNKIINGVTKSPSLDTVKAISAALNRTLDDFYDAPKSGMLSVEEHDHIKKYRTLDEHGKEVVDIVLDREAERMVKIGRTEGDDTITTMLPMWTISDNKMITLPLLMQSRSAGFGDFSDDETTEDMQVQLTDATRRADYLITVHGNSMEPDYMDGCIVAVKLQEDVQIGEVGVFVSDRGSHIKRRGKERLESINKDYPDVIPAKGTICRGLVLGVVK